MMKQTEIKKFLIIGIGINVRKSPKINNYPTTSLLELTNKTINKTDIENKLKLIFEKNLYFSRVNLNTLKGVFAKNERGYRLTSKNKRF